MSPQLLREVTSYEEVLLWKEKLNCFKPFSLTMLNTLDMCNKHKLLDDIHAPVKVYVPSGDHPPIFILTTPPTSQKKLTEATLFWDIKTLSSDDVKSLLLQLPGWDLTKHLLFFLTYSPLIEELTNILNCSSEGAPVEEARMIEQEDCIVYSLNKLTCPVPELDPDFEVRPLTEEHMELVFSHWPYTWCEDLNLMTLRIKKFPALAIFHKQRDGKDLPVSWMIQYKDGTVGMTFTLSEYRRRGFATILYQHMLQTLQQSGDHSIYVTIVRDNEQSVRFHENIGFTEESYFSYSLYLPKFLDFEKLKQDVAKA